MKIAQQKVKIYESIIKVKQKEGNKTYKYICKGRFCKIDHGKSNWLKTKPGDLYRDISNELLIQDVLNADCKQTLLGKDLGDNAKTNSQIF